MFLFLFFLLVQILLLVDSCRYSCQQIHVDTPASRFMQTSTSLVHPWKQFPNDCYARSHIPQSWPPGFTSLYTHSCSRNHGLWWVRKLICVSVMSVFHMIINWVFFAFLPVVKMVCQTNLIQTVLDLDSADTAVWIMPNIHMHASSFSGTCETQTTTQLHMG